MEPESGLVLNKWANSGFRHLSEAKVEEPRISPFIRGDGQVEE